MEPESPDWEQTIVRVKEDLCVALARDPNFNYDEPVLRLVHINCDLSQKYTVIDLAGLLRDNIKRLLDEFKKIIQAFNILEKYVRHLMKPAEQRSANWKYIKYSNPIFKDRVDSIQGGRGIMRHIGYTMDIQDGLAFPENTEPDRVLLVHLLVEILMGREEMELYVNLQHPNPHIVEKHLPTKVIDAVIHMKKMKGMSIGSVQQEAYRKAPNSYVQSNNYGNQSIATSQQPITNQQSSTNNYPYQVSSAGNSPMSTQQLQSQTVYPDVLANVNQMLIDNQSKQSLQNIDYLKTSQNKAVRGRPAEDHEYVNATVKIEGEPTLTGAEPYNTEDDSLVEDHRMNRDMANTQSLPYSSVVCDICGANAAEIICFEAMCGNKQLCITCDEKWHLHPKRKNHKRDRIHPNKDITAVSSNDSKPSDMLRQQKDKLSALANENKPAVIQYYALQNKGNNIPSFPVQSSTSSHQPPPSEPMSQGPSMSMMPSTTAPGGPPSGDTTTLRRLRNIENLPMRVARAEIKLKAFEAEIEEIEEDIKDIVLRREDFYEDLSYIRLFKEKGKLLREKIFLEKHLTQWELELGQGGSPVVNPGAHAGLPIPNTSQSMINRQGQGQTQSMYIGQGQNHGSPRGIGGQIFYPPGDAPSIPVTPISLTPPTYPHQEFYDQQGKVQRSNSGIPISQVDQTSHRPISEAPGRARHDNNSRAPIMYPGSSEKTYPTFPQRVASSPGMLNQMNSHQQGHHPYQQQQLAQDLEYPRDSEEHVPPLSMVAEQRQQEIKLKSSSSGPNLRLPEAIVDTVTTDNRRWICEHCTMYNPMNVRVCHMCCKTSNNPTIIQEQESPSPQAQGQGQEENDLDETKVIAMAGKIGDRLKQYYDQVDIEKKEAQKKFQEKEQTQKRTTNDAVTDRPIRDLHTDNLVSPTSQGPKPCSDYMQMESCQSELPTLGAQLKTDSLEPSSKAESPRKHPSLLHLMNKSPEGSLKSSNGGSPNNSFQDSMEEIDRKRKIETSIKEGRELVRYLREAEKSGFSMDEMEFAYNLMEKNGKSALDWLSRTWNSLVHNVISLGMLRNNSLQVKVGQDISEYEAKITLINCQANVDNALNLCIEKRMDVFEFLKKLGTYNVDMILRAVISGQGDQEMSKEALYREVTLPFSRRVYGENQEEDGHDVPLYSILQKKSFQDYIMDNTVDRDSRKRKIMFEGKLQGWSRAERVLTILEKEVLTGNIEATLDDVVEAVRSKADYQAAIHYLKQDCLLCYEQFPMSKMRNLICPCNICVTCMTSYFEINIRERHVRNLSCPSCNLPDMGDVDKASEYLSFLSMLLKHLISKDLMDVYETKLRDWHLQKDPKFRWCAHCGNGFIWEQAERDPHMKCVICHKGTCYNCKKQWEDQHTGLTCEEFEKWKFDNDPENQNIGLAKHLEKNGIDCPSCKMRYDLAKGGCMHFVCPECGHQFCSGCSKPFVKDVPCEGYKTCKGKGLHCHHPRDCFYYLRDQSVAELQKVLTDKKLAFDTKAAGDLVQPTHCQVMELKDVLDGREDQACGRPVNKDQAGLCEIHYKEYLVGIMNKNKIDPLCILDINGMARLIEREEKTVPVRKQDEKDSTYRQRLKQFIREKIPLNR